MSVPPREDSAVLVIGEALLDIVHDGSTTVEHPGGSPANVALGLGRRGVPVAFLTDIGRDSAASSIVRHLEASGVRVLEESFSDRPTSRATATIGPDGSASYRFDVQWRPSAAPLPVSARAVHTGSIAAFLAPGRAAVLQHLDRVDAPVVTFDPNIRPALLGSHRETLQAFEELAGRSDAVKLSDEDAAWLYPGCTPDDVAGSVGRLGPALTVVTLGEDGAILSSVHGQVRVPAVASRVVDTIGAGDTYMASLIDDLLTGRGSPLDEASLNRVGRRAAAAAAITVSRPGADLPWRDEIDHLSEGPL